MLITGLAAGGKDYLVDFTTCDNVADLSHQLCISDSRVKP